MSPFTLLTPSNNQTPSLRYYRWFVTWISFILLTRSWWQVFYNWIFQGVVYTAGGNKMAWHCITFYYNALQCICIARDVGGWRLVGGWHFTGGFPLKLSREFVFWGFHRCNVRLAVYRGVLYWGLTILFVPTGWGVHWGRCWQRFTEASMGMEWTYR
jgi:hypothetical protein